MTTPIYKDYWKAYLQLGLIPYPASNQYKGPIEKWKFDENKQPLPPPVMDDYLYWEDKYPNSNVWVLLGDEFAVIDPDGPDAEEFVKGLNLPKCPTSKSGNKSIHRWFKTPSPLEHITVKNGGDQTYLEVRTGEHGMFVPPDIHPETGKPYQWIEGLSPWEVDFPDFPIQAYQKIKSLSHKPESKPQKEINVEGKLDVEAYLNHYGVPFQRRKEATRTFYDLKRCPFENEHTVADKDWQSAIIQGQSGVVTFYCFHNHCGTKTWANVRSFISGNDPIFQFSKGYSPPAAEKAVTGSIEDSPINQPSKSKQEKLIKDFGQPYGASEIINHPIEQDEAYIDRLMFAGDQGYLIAIYKLGKTNLMIQETICLACEIPFLGMPISKARRVFYLRFELKESRFRERFNKMLMAVGGPTKIKQEPYFQLVRGFDIKRGSDFDWLLNTLDRLHTEVCLIDPMYKLSPSTKLREDEGGIYTTRFDELKVHFPKLHVQVAHHPRKSIGGIPDNTWDSAYGSMFLYANMDYEIKLSKKGREKNVFEFSHISNDIPIDPFTFKRDPVSLLYELETKEDTKNKWQRDYFQICNQIRSGLKTKTNLKTWMQQALKYTRRDTDECIEYLLQSNQLEWIGKSKTRGNLAVPDCEIESQDSNQTNLPLGKNELV